MLLFAGAMQQQTRSAVLSLVVAAHPLPLLVYGSPYEFGESAGWAVRCGGCFRKTEHSCRQSVGGAVSTLILLYGVSAERSGGEEPVEVGDAEVLPREQAERGPGLLLHAPAFQSHLLEVLQNLRQAQRPQRTLARERTQGLLLDQRRPQLHRRHPHRPVRCPAVDPPPPDILLQNRSHPRVRGQEADRGHGRADRLGAARGRDPRCHRRRQLRPHQQVERVRQEALRRLSQKISADGQAVPRTLAQPPRPQQKTRRLDARGGYAHRRPPALHRQALVQNRQEAGQQPHRTHDQKSIQDHHLQAETAVPAHQVRGTAHQGLRRTPGHHDLPPQAQRQGHLRADRHQVRAQVRRARAQAGGRGGAKRGVGGAEGAEQGGGAGVSGGRGAGPERAGGGGGEQEQAAADERRLRHPTGLFALVREHPDDAHLLAHRALLRQLLLQLPALLRLRLRQQLLRPQEARPC